FCVKLTEIEKAAGRLPEGYEYTLPTEAQWEYACRAGTTTALNSGKNLSDKNECPEMDEVGWYKYNSGDKTHSVGQKLPNAWGLYNMHGSVEEWCQDWAKDYPAGAATDPTGPKTGTYRIVRGGGWNEDARYCRSASRDISEPDSFWPGTGFRVALTQNVIERQPLTITINTTKVFDGTPLVSDYTVATVEGLLSGDKLISGVVTTKSADADSYSYIAGTSEITTPFATAYGIANYTVTYVITQNIFPAGLVITIKDTKLYDGTPLVSSYTKATATGLMPGDKLTAGAATSAKAEVGSYLYPGTSTITTPFATAYGIGNYTVIYTITQNIIQSDHSNKTIPLAEDVNLDMIWIEPGTFIMGSPEDELGRDSEETQHKVTLTQGYWMGKYEVTQTQYEAIMGTNPSWRHKGADLPVDDVSWLEAMEFCEKLTAIERAAGRLPRGYGYTLPTEEQWEYACRAGTTTALNSGKNLSGEWECPEMDEVGWYYCNSNDTTHPVGQKLPNAWGLYDMHGNVEEFCLDEDKDPFWKGWHVVCGGDYSSFADDCRSGAHGTAMNAGFIGKGFRVALAPVDLNITIPLSNSVELTMIWIEPGTFIMGSPKDELGRNSNETQHEVTLTQGYWLGKYEVTQAQYEAVTGSNPSEFIGGDLPVENVTWYEAKAFCVKLTEIEKAAGRLPEGYEYTLPTEAQWEYVCR
ncbi:MAG: SUMF1/EgtB/PvdO family nonheme iron enzyme, partial [Verrucomicrobia bacterium]|nr:SUMF1/EgtB/PvdO family nonheme iron enzyme [Verrucomicrobiota bacterium]